MLPNAFVNEVSSQWAEIRERFTSLTMPSSLRRDKNHSVLGQDYSHRWWSKRPYLNCLRKSFFPFAQCGLSLSWIKTTSDEKFLYVCFGCSVETTKSFYNKIPLLLLPPAWFQKHYILLLTLSISHLSEASIKVSMFNWPYLSYTHREEIRGEIVSLL